ncbi:Ppx/GppA phosphatase family protein [Massilia sp. DD77]|uniref:Ppx/GppA phosphatase family protein n=1 Tax=Massilia sp. DD77 TaxID=3109349 RepID=UPI002FFE313E
MTLSTPESPLYAAVELGSDSFRLHVGRVEDGTVQLAATMSEPVRLAATLDEDGNLCAAAMRRALGCLGEFRRALDAWRPEAVRVVATSALRMARNAGVFLPAAEGALGRRIELIDGGEGGRLVYLGVASTLGEAGQEPRLVIDIGSASTELVLGRGERIERVESFAVGAVRQSLSFFSDGRIDEAGFEAAVRSGRSRFAQAGLARQPGRRAYGACGTVRALAEIAGAGGEARLDRDCLARLRRMVVEAGHLARVRLAWEPAARAPHLPGGLALLIALMDEFGIDEVAPVHAGLRVGALWDLHARAAALA